MPGKIATAVPPDMAHLASFFARRDAGRGTSLLSVGRRLPLAGVVVLATATLASAQSPAPSPRWVRGWAPCADDKLAGDDQDDQIENDF